MHIQTQDHRPSLLAVSGLEYPDQRQPDPDDKNQQQEEQLDPGTDAREVDDDQLDEALEETFPASDPISP